MKTIHRQLLQAAALVVSAIAALPSHAELVVATPGGIAATTITFSPYDAETNPVVVNPPVNVGTAEGKASVELSFSDPDASHILGAVSLSLGTNGAWPFSGGYAGLNSDSGVMTFKFIGGMNFVGGFMNYNRNTDSSVIVTALDINFEPIPGESLDLSTVMADFGAGNGLFYGFSLASPDIWGFELSSGNVVIDNLTFGRFGQVPEPGALALVLAALAGLGWQQQRRTARSR